MWFLVEKCGIVIVVFMVFRLNFGIYIIRKFVLIFRGVRKFYIISIFGFIVKLVVLFFVILFYE